MRKIKYLLYIVLISCFCSISHSANKKSKVNSLVKKYDLNKKNLKKNEEKFRVVLGDIFTTNRKIKKLRFKMNRLTNEILSAQGKIKDTSKEIVHQEIEVESQIKSLGKTLRWSYREERNLNPMNLLFSSKSPKQVNRTMFALNSLSRKQAQKVKLYKEAVEQLKNKKKTLKKEIAKLLTANQKFKSEETELKKEESNKSRLLSLIESKKDKYKKELRKLRKSTESDQQAISNMSLNTLFFELKGQLSSPLLGKIGKKFGLDYNQKFRTRQIHKGIFINAKVNNKVRSVFSGQVEYSGPIPGYGLSLLVSHGDNYYSLYSYNKELKVKKGDSIKRGAVIALSGYSKLHKSAGLYFEIRHYTEALDPEKWFNNENTKKQIIGASLEAN